LPVVSRRCSSAWCQPWGGCSVARRTFSCTSPDISRLCTRPSASSRSCGGSERLPRDWAADDERRELTGVPDELAFATKPQLAAAMLERAREAGMPARWVAADEVYGGRDLRTRIRELGYDDAIAVPASHRVTTPADRWTAACHRHREWGELASQRPEHPQ